MTVCAPLKLLYHESFDLVGLDRDVAHEVEVFGFANDDVVLEADTDVFFLDVDAWFDGENIAHCERSVRW